jgi:hypothetical protein
MKKAQEGIKVIKILNWLELSFRLSSDPFCRDLEDRPTDIMTIVPAM